MKPKVLLTRAYAPRVLDVLRREFDLEVGAEDRSLSMSELRARVADKHAIISMLDDSMDAELMDIAPNLRIIANYAVGYDNVDVGHAIKRGIMVTHTPGVLTEATADIAFALLLAVARRIVEAHQLTLSGGFKGWEPNLLVGQDLCGKTVGIVGMGRIGAAFARRCRGFDLRVLYTKSRRLDPTDEARLGVHYRPLDELLAESDFVSLHVPLNPKTHHLLDRRRLSLMKPHAILINTARGPVIDEAALVDLLKQGRIGGAGLDVYEREPQLTPGLWESGRVVLLPHIGSATEGTRDRMAMMTVEALRACFSGGRPEFLVPEWRAHLADTAE